MKTLLFLITFLCSYSVFSQDTISKIEVIKGKKTLIREIIQQPGVFSHYAKIIAIVLMLIATYVFIFYKPKSKRNG